MVAKMNYLEIVKQYARLVPENTTADAVEKMSPGSIEVMRRVIDYHFTQNVEEQMAVCALGAALVLSRNVVKDRIRSPLLTDREREIFRMFLMYDRELIASNKSESLETIINEL